jgi:hypothetical protein
MKGQSRRDIEKLSSKVKLAAPKVNALAEKRV